MEANLTSPVRLPFRWSQGHRVGALAVVGLHVVVVTLAALVCGRRVVGALERPAPGLLLLAFGAGLASYCWFSRRLWRARVRPRVNGRSLLGIDSLVGWGPTLAVVLLTVGLSWPLERLVDWLVWAPIWGADFLWRRAFFGSDPPRLPSAGKVQRRDPAMAVPLEIPSAPDLDGQAGGVVLQQWTRIRDGDGRESISASLCAEFAPGQRTVEVYIGFCPPFETLPELELEQADGPAARISIGQVLPHGARIDVRLQEAACRPGEVRIDLFATAAAESR